MRAGVVTNGRPVGLRLGPLRLYRAENMGMWGLVLGRLHAVCWGPSLNGAQGLWCLHLPRIIVTWGRP